ncbi:Lrp/AsnC family transcriptional regulator [Natrarchaeobius chitinivorans]|uniref:Lrp/AsnC family transcriptional regulator n=1 Tax=Natrarchaeobius chitinivorans TaxID=1679083 RepID=A0A3N6P394_NATCH|nr:Lrp/AsnC family transcriptional regulator [Natrarchaeobius chitinivorans]RQG89725.1 Lrp/AsnC family transcriptional regulator [Natrarchaeobius chitinivorans]
MSPTLDKRDIDILFAIAEQQTPSTEAIHQSTGIPKSTVHYRLQSLKDDGVLTNDLYELDREKLGLEITVISEIRAEYGEGYHERIGKQLGEVEGINQVYFTMGDTDFIIIARLSSRDDVEELIGKFESIDGVERSSSKFAISTIKENVSVSNLQDYTKEKLLDAQDASDSDGTE